jgi:hypothetical protein
MKIEVTWVCTPKSGITEIELSDLDCKSVEEWYALTKEEQDKRLAKQIEERDLSSVKFTPTEWDLI